MNNIQKTLSIIKPDAVQRNLTEEIKSIFKKNGFEIISEKKIKIIGLRPGEKIHEEMISKDDMRNVAEFDKFFVIVSNSEFRNFSLGNYLKKNKSAKKVKKINSYNSYDNDEFLSYKEIQSIINKNIKDFVY